jgi:hypothetical protein
VETGYFDFGAVERLGIMQMTSTLAEVILREM